MRIFFACFFLITIGFPFVFGTYIKWFRYADMNHDNKITEKEYEMAIKDDEFRRVAEGLKIGNFTVLEFEDFFHIVREGIYFT